MSDAKPDLQNEAKPQGLDQALVDVRDALDVYEVPLSGYSQIMTAVRSLNTALAAAEQRIAELEEEVARYEERDLQMTDAMTRWGWGHCTSDRELIEQIDSMIREAEERKGESSDE